MKKLSFSQSCFYYQEDSFLGFLRQLCFWLTCSVGNWCRVVWESSAIHKWFDFSFLPPSYFANSCNIFLGRKPKKLSFLNLHVNTEGEVGILSSFSCSLSLVKLLILYTRNTVSREIGFKTWFLWLLSYVNMGWLKFLLRKKKNQQVFPICFKNAITNGVG